MKLKFDKQKNKWIELEKGSKDPDSIYLDGFLKEKLDLVKALIEKDWDAVLLLDGLERVGKSILGMTIGHYLSNGKMTEKNFCAGIDDCPEVIKAVPNKSVVFVDEGSLVFNSKDAMNKKQKQLMKILDVVGQKQLVFIICLPSFFDLNRQIAIRRSRMLLHVYPSKNWERGRFAYYTMKKKKLLYELGKRNFNSYSKPHPSFRGKFVDFKPKFYEEYLKIKKKSMLEALDIGKKEALTPSQIKTQLMIEFKKNNPLITNESIAKGFGMCKSSYYKRLGGVKTQ